MSIAKKIAIAATSVAGGALIFSLVAFAQTENPSGATHEAAKTEAKNMINISPAGRATLRGTLGAVGQGTITVQSWGGNWTINVGADTKIIRRYGGKSNLSELQQGDMVGVEGKINQSSSWTIDANNVQDLSIQVRGANFLGTISSLSGNSFSLTTGKRGVIAVTVNADAKIVVNGKTGSVSDLQNGMWAAVNGLGDKTQKTIAADRVIARTIAAGTQHGNKGEKNQSQNQGNQ